MRQFTPFFVMLALLAGFSTDAAACYWDRDTLAMEKRRFPSVIKLISGRFLRHSDALYDWRTYNRKSRLKEDPHNLQLLDDLGVAYDKLGKYEQAIATAQKALSIQPERYETHANLGTFLIHAKRYQEGLVHIKKAIQINPKAHFGREIIQQHLVEYVIQQRKTHPTGLPLRRSCIEQNPKLLENPFYTEGKDTYLHPKSKHICMSMNVKDGFAFYVNQKGVKTKDAIKGVLGMMKFSNHQHPILLEALGDLLIGSSKRLYNQKDGKRLAARAYFAAGLNSPNQATKKAYQAKAALALVGHRMGLEQLQAKFVREREKGQDYFYSIQRNEQVWIKKGLNPDREFEKKYYRKKRR